MLAILKKLIDSQCSVELWRDDEAAAKDRFVCSIVPYAETVHHHLVTVGHGPTLEKAVRTAAQGWEESQ